MNTEGLSPFVLPCRLVPYNPVEGGPVLRNLCEFIIPEFVKGAKTGGEVSSLSAFGGPGGG